MASGSNTSPTRTSSASTLAPHPDTAPGGATGQSGATMRSSDTVVAGNGVEEEDEIGPDDPVNDYMANVPDLGKVGTSPLKLSEALDQGVPKRVALAGLALTPASICLADLCSTEDTRLVGIPAVKHHLDNGFFFQDGYGGLEAFVQVERLATSEKAVLFQFFDESDNLDDHVLTPRGDSLQGPELENLLSGLSFRHNFAQRVFGTVSVLRRVAQKLTRVQAELGDASDVTRDTSGVQDALDHLKREFQLGIASRDQRITNLEVEKEEVIRNIRTDTLKLMHEHERDNRGLRQQVDDLRQQVEVEKSRRQGLESQLARSTFSPADLMNFLGSDSHAQVQLNWQRLLDLLIRFRDGGPVPPTWRTVINVMTSDDLRPSFPLFARMTRPNDDGESKDSGPPPSANVDLTRDPSSGTLGKSPSKKRLSFGTGSS
ncbi:hypothetical protein V7S43_004381 [Phytophthora oleae]|uniref:Uncharacterized protein n=1 Tax=Phytophthora oleae TaxID=2107226 RepID=A0ABD3FT03_9STRA